ncbi:MAG: hypothetical protein HQL99_04205, partial [Magnetococcales bacterium]|nr:hypothetical protein [Magnetococcales bacterium]
MSENREVAGGTDLGGFEEDRQNLDDMTVLQEVKSVDLSAEENRNAESNQITDQLVVMGSVQMGSRLEVDHSIATSIDLETEKTTDDTKKADSGTQTDDLSPDNGSVVASGAEAVMPPTEVEQVGVASVTVRPATVADSESSDFSPVAGPEVAVVTEVTSPETVAVPVVAATAEPVADPLPEDQTSENPTDETPDETETEPGLDPYLETPQVDAPEVADGATIAWSDAVGREDNAIPLQIEVVQADADESLSVYIEGVPTGATLSAGEDLGDGLWSLRSEDLVGLTLTPAADSDADFALVVRTVTMELATGETSITTQTLNVEVQAVADAPTLVLNDASGTEDQAISLNLSAMLTDTDGSESLSITLAGVPSGAVLSSGVDNGDGSWTLTSDQLTGLTLTPPANSDADFTLTVTATSTEADGGDVAIQTGTIAVSVAADADAPTLVLNDASGTEDQAISLVQCAMLTDTDSSESLSITLAGVPSGAVLSAGVDNGD